MNRPYYLNYLTIQTFTLSNNSFSYNIYILDIPTKK